jgi:hypothetical protein
MDIGYAVLAMVILVSGMLLAVQFKPPKKLTAKTEKFIHSFGQGIYGTFAAVAIMIAGFLYLVERQWSPRFSVDLKTRTMLLPVEGKEPHAVIQLFIAVQNRGRTVQKVKNIEVFADSLNKLTDLKNNRHGDLQGRNVYAFARLKTNTIAPGEVDVIAVEIPIACRERLVRLLVKVPQPPYREKVEPGATRPVYERKLLVPVEAACRQPSSPPTETSFITAEPLVEE